MKAKWNKRYELSISEKLTLKDIMLLCDCGKPTAMTIRNEAIKYCVANNIEMYSRSIPTDAVLQVINKTIDYYYKKMELESKKLCYE